MTEYGTSAVRAVRTAFHLPTHHVSRSRRSTEMTMKLQAALIALPALLILVGASRADDMFPFPIQTLNANHDATDMSWMNERPAGKSGFVSVKDGHFVDGKGKRVRFLGVNIGYSGCFPEHAIAEKLAARLAKLGRLIPPTTNAKNVEHTPAQTRATILPMSASARTKKTRAVCRTGGEAECLARCSVWIWGWRSSMPAWRSSWDRSPQGHRSRRLSTGNNTSFSAGTHSVA